MKTTITAKLKLHTDPQQFQQVRSTQLAYRDALNVVSRYAFAFGKTSKVMALHKGMYNEIRTRFHLPSQLACSAERQVGATYKGLWTKAKKNAEQRKAGITRKRYKGLDQPPKYISPTLTYTYQRDYTLKKDQHVSILTLDGRVSVPYTGYAEHIKLIQQGGEIGAAKLWYDKSKKRLYLLVTLMVEVPDPTLQTHTQVVGVDVGIRYLAVTTTTKGKSSFHSGKRVRAKANHYARLS
jgi:predicted transposase